MSTGTLHTFISAQYMRNSSIHLPIKYLIKASGVIEWEIKTEKRTPDIF
jgi:hypothetical protein